MHDKDRKDPSQPKEADFLLGAWVVEIYQLEGYRII